jgi:hypothetical protein
LDAGFAPGRECEMVAQVYNLRDYQSEKDRVRIAKMAAEIMSQIDTAPCEMIPYHGAGIDGIPYQAPPEDCA